MSDSAVVWHEVECGSYAADLALWEELAADAAGPVLELGCGAGRVALHLARLGHEVVGIDTDRELVDALNGRAAAAGMPARASVADATDFDLDRRFSLVLAPMQLVQILGGPDRRRAMLARVTAHLAPGGLLAVALVEARHLPVTDFVDQEDSPLPDVREQDGWVYSSRPVGLRRDGGRMSIERLRQSVSPRGEIAEQVDITELDPLPPDTLASEAREGGLRPAGMREVVPTHWHVGSSVCLLEGV